MSVTLDAGSVDKIRAELKSKAPTTQTLRYLRAVLGLGNHEPCTTKQRQPQTKKQAQAKNPLISRPPVKPALKKRPKQGEAFNIHDSNGSRTPEFSQNDRVRLATETFNFTLKSLSDAVKTLKSNAESTEGSNTPLRLPHQDPALQERSPNKESKNSGVKSKPVDQNGERVDWELVAECCHSALEYLRQNGNEAATSRTDTNTSLENAALILLDRTISLRLTSEAVRQLFDIHQIYWKGYAKQNSASECTIAALLLGRPDSTDDDALFGFTASMQSQAIRLMLLLGPKSTDKNLIYSLSPDTPGSPAWVIVQGLQKGRPKSQQSGLQLRTISLAISKLYAQGIKSKVEKPFPMDSFNLFQSALCIKFNSWAKLGHTPEPVRDVWNPLHSSIKQLLAESDVTSNVSGQVVDSLAIIRKLLDLPSQEHEIPMELTHTLLRSLKDPETFAKLASILEGSSAACKNSDLIQLCQITTARLKAFPHDKSAAVTSIKAMESVLTEAVVLPRADFDRSLLHLAQLRKAVSELLSDLKTNQKLPKQDESVKEFRMNLISLTYIAFKFLKRHVATALTAMPESALTQSQTAFTITFVKSIESVLATEQYITSESSELIQVSLDVLKDCSSALQGLRNDYKSSLCQSSCEAQHGLLQLRLSQAAWSLYLAAIKQGKPLGEQVAILELSLHGLPEMSVTDQKTAYTALKFERLAYCYLELHNFGLAAKAMRNAIDSNIRQGVLTDLVESLLSGSFHEAWSEQDPSRKAFGKLITTFIKTRLLNSPKTSERLFYDDDSLPATHRAVLIEKQVLTILESEIYPSHKDLCASMVRLVSELMQRPEHMLYLARFANHLIRIGLQKRVSPSDFVIDSATIQQLLNKDICTKETVFLRRFESELRSILRLQYGCFTGDITRKGLTQAVHQLSELIRDCNTLEKVRAECEDVTSFTAPLIFAVDFATTVEENRIALTALETLEHLSNLTLRVPGVSRPNIIIRKHHVYMQLRELQPAENALAEAAAVQAVHSVDSLTQIETALAYAEYHLQLMRLEDCSLWLSRAKKVWETESGSAASSSIKSRLAEQTLLGKAAYLASQLAYQHGHLLEAIVLARQSAKIAASLWASIEKSCVGPMSHGREATDAGLSNLSNELAKLDLHREVVPQVATRMVSYASSVALCCTAFNHMAFLNAHCGIYQDAAVFYEQALKISRKAGHWTSNTICLSELSVLHARAGQVDKARAVLQQLLENAKHCTTNTQQAIVFANQGEAYLILGDQTAASQCLNEAKRREIAFGPPAEKPPTGVPTKSKQAKTKTNNPSKRSVVKRKKDAQAPTAPSASVVRSIPTLEVRAVTSRIAALEARLKSPESSDLMIGGDAISNCTRSDEVRQLMTLASSLVESAFHSFSEDAIHNVLAETAVALPVRYRSSRKSGRVSFVQGRTVQGVLGGKVTSVKQKRSEKSTRDGNAFLLQAYNILQRIHDFSPDRLPSDLVHASHRLSTQITLLSSVLTEPLTPSSLDLVLDITSPLRLAQQREGFITLGEVHASRRTNAQEWPTADAISDRHMISSSNSVERYDWNLLPPSWSVAYLGLDENMTELFVARLKHETSPFVVRIPLARSDPSDEDIDQLDLKSAKAEMKELILKANSSAHDPRGSSVNKTVRSAWYAGRQELDEQVATLLDNIENLWFGGFRGLLSGFCPKEGKLSKFRECLSTSLNRHLPSRQKSSKSGDSIIQLHDHVLELFVGLGDPRGADLEDAVTDLLYFVVDVLQFNGERNAYDEIDFDAMVVELLDALHAFHDGSSASEPKTDHTILVLDKELQVFPWESLPCLRGRAVSRMPSLDSVWEQLRSIRERSNHAESYPISKASGAYILNPSSDLKSTQETFEQLLKDQLPGYKAIVNRPPQGDEMEAALKTHDLMLYFGHGGGGQYIRPRSIRKMDHCAVTLLMGCSSAKLTEYGAYEPYGMPLSYLSGGSHAVVGTLWDVTDRDIDRYALELMEDWGLIHGSNDSTAQGGKKSAKSKARKGANRLGDLQKSRPVSLDQAVANARDACLLKYLNGAAPVMYGIPVVLE